MIHSHHVYVDDNRSECLDNYNVCHQEQRQNCGEIYDSCKQKEHIFGGIIFVPVGLIFLFVFFGFFRSLMSHR